MDSPHWAARECSQWSSTLWIVGKIARTAQIRMKERKKKNESNCSICRLLSKIGDCSYGIFYIHMAVLMIVGRIIKSENWYKNLVIELVSKLDFEIKIEKSDLESDILI